MKSVMISNWSLIFAFALVLVSIAISAKEKLGLGKDIIISVVRAVIQLVIVGYILKYIIHVNNIFLTLAMTIVIILNASYNAMERDPNPDHKFIHSLIAEAVGTYVVLAILVFSGSIKPTPMQVIPITGMIAGNEMVAVGLCYKSLANSFHDQRQQTLEKLALGADVHLASQSILRRSIKTAMQPTIDSAKTVGLVNLPGMMSGLIFAGVDPVYAIKYQIMITFMLLAATALGSVLAGYLAYRNYFNKRMQLKG